MLPYRAQVATTVYMMVIVLARPYVRADDDLLAMLSENEIFLLIWCAVLAVPTICQDAFHVSMMIACAAVRTS